jgi:hypothetical protein
MVIANYRLRYSINRQKEITLVTNNQKRDFDKRANRDPITGAPGAHPVGVGVGAAAGGAAAGAAAGAVAGPVGTLVGASLGAVAGGLAGKAAAEAIDPTIEDQYWRENYNSEPYYKPGRTYDDYVQAYRTGYEGRARYSAKSFDEVQRDLEIDYNKRRGTTGVTWDEAQHPARAAWERADQNKVRRSGQDVRR